MLKLFIHLIANSLWLGDVSGAVSLQQQQQYDRVGQFNLRSHSEQQ